MNIKLLVILLVFIGPTIVYAETGNNFDRELISDDGSKRIYQWTSHYERILDGQDWVNYKWNDDGNIITFESASMGYKFDKNSCEFSLLSPITKEVSIQSFHHQLIVDGIVEPLSSCNITNIMPTPDSLDITIVRHDTDGELKTLYVVGADGMMEWTHEITNTNIMKFAKYGVIDTCEKCTPEKTVGDLTSFGDYTLDTKNAVHNALKSAQPTDGNFTFTYEGDAMLVGQKLIIDPVFGYSTGTHRSLYTTVGGGGACPVVDTASDNTLGWVKADSSPSGACYRTTVGWNITSIPPTALDVQDTTLRYDVTSINVGRNCDFNAITLNQTTAPRAALWEDIADGPSYVSNDSGCTTISNDKILDLGSSADIAIETNATSGFFVVGIKLNNEARDPTNYGSVIGTTELQVTYLTNVGMTVFPSVLNQDVIGDTMQLDGTIFVNGTVGTYGNITDTRLLVNSTTVIANVTGQNQTIPYTVNFGPWWYHMNSTNLYNFTMVITVQNSSQTITNYSSLYDSPDYAVSYITAEVPAQGDVNATYINGEFVVNRDIAGNITETWQIECAFRNWAAVFFNSTDATWDNQTNIGAFSKSDLVQNTDYYVSCYNDDLLFGDFFLPLNATNYIAPGLQIFDALGGFLGAPSVLLVILAIFSWGTGRNFPIVLVIGVSALGLMGALGLLVLDGSLWAVIFVLAGIGIFGVRKFF